MKKVQTLKPEKDASHFRNGRLKKVLLQRILASYSGFSLPLHSSGFLAIAFGDGEICLVSEKPDYFAKMRFATHPIASFGLKGLSTCQRG